MILLMIQNDILYLQFDLMFDWIFGSSKAKEEKKSEKSAEGLAKEDLWAYDFVKQYLVSPLWRNPLLDFLEENCIIFEDSEENKFQYTKIHKQFIDLCGLLLQSITEEAGIPEHILEQCIIKGISDKRDHKIFQQVLLCDNFLAFKKIMVSKNKQLEIAATQAESVKKGIKISPEQQKIDEKQLERLQIEKAIALSLAMEEKIKQQQEKQFEQAIRLSQLQAQKQQEKKEKSSKITNQSLPPLVIGSNRLSRPISEFKEEQKVLIKEIETLKIKQQSQKKQQNTEERKKRLMEQRELIRKKKMQQRKEELTAFVQNKQTSSNTEQPKVSEEELERRRKLMQKLKQQLKD